CVVAALLGLTFMMLDKRNRDLLNLAEELLTELEKNAIFGDGITIKDRRGNDIYLGILARQSAEDNARGRCCAWLRDVSGGRHRVWLPWVGALMGTLFLIAAFWI